MPGKRFVVAGLGNFGSGVAWKLCQLGHRVVAIDLSRQKAQKLADLAERTVIGDATDPAVLAASGIESCDAGIVSLGEDVAASVLTTLALRDLQVREIFVKVVSDLHTRIIEKVGGAETVFPEREAAQLVARRVSNRSILRYAGLGPGLSAEELAVPEEWIGRTLRELELPKRYQVTVIAVKDYLLGVTQPVPDPDAPLKDSDSLVLAGPETALRRLSG